MRRCWKCGSANIIPLTEPRLMVVNEDSDITYTEHDLVCIDCGAAILEAYV